MNILFVCHRFPFPPKRGGKIRPFNIIKHLHEQGHQVHVCSLSRSETEAIEGNGLEAFCSSAFSAMVTPKRQLVRMILRLPTSTPSSMGYFFSPALKARIDSIISNGNIDLIIVHCSSVAQYVENVTGIPKVLDYGDMDSQKWLEYSVHKPFPLSIGYLIEGRKLMAAEKKLASKFSICTTTTYGELETLQSLTRKTPSDWFPNGVDANHFVPNDRFDPELISFIGRMDYYPNQQSVLDFVTNVFPIIRSTRPEAKFVVVGAEPPQKIRDLAKVNGVTVTGTVADVRSYVTNSVVNVANLEIARGTQNKILESMAMGVPVVASPAAAKGVDAIAGEHLLVGTNHRELANQILAVMNSPQLRSQLAKAGRERVLHNHSWPESMKKLDSILSRLVHPGPEKHKKAEVLV